MFIYNQTFLAPMTIATGFNRLALDLEEHIRQYKPGNWVEPIRSVASTPYFSADEAKTFLDAHKKGELKTTLDELGEQKGFPYNQVKPWYVKEAICHFFNTGAYKACENELT